MDIFDILIVEDDEPTIESWERDIRDFNRREGAIVRFTASFARTRAQALHVLSRNRIDCAVIDLRLPEGADDNAAGQPLGNDVLQRVLEEVGIPAFVYSGYEGEVSEAVQRSQIRIVTKQGGAAEQILKDFASQSDLMHAMGMVRQEIARETARLFNQSIWQRWQERWVKHPDRTQLGGIIARQTAAHIYEVLAQTPAKHHPDEFYFVPPLYPDRFDTGDLVQSGDELLVVLTPRCNMANKQPSHLMLAVCEPLSAWTEWSESLHSGKGKQDRASKALESHATQGHEIASHFLPPLDGEGPWLVNFREVRAVKASDLAPLLSSRIGSVAPQFVPNLVQRYAAYLGRIGQPEIDSGILVDTCKGVRPKEGANLSPGS